MRPLSLAVLGAGFGGIGLGIQLKKAGLHDFVIHEKADRLGGTWRDNTYPGAACDVPSLLYSYSFEPRHDWPHVYSEQPEIHRYLEHCADKYGVRPHIRFGSEIVASTFDARRGVWRLRDARGIESEADVLVSAIGQLNRPHVPELSGLADFEGEIFHSAQWNHAHALEGRTVGVIGSGASAIQIVPRVARSADALLLFQRTPSWVIEPLPNNRRYRAWETWMRRHVPGLARAQRLALAAMFDARVSALTTKDSKLAAFMTWAARRHLDEKIADPSLRAALTPDYPLGCKRILVSNEYLDALVRPNVRLITDRITRITPRGVLARSPDGETEHALDTLVLATGFDTSSFLASLDVRGLGDRSLAEAWREGPEAYLGIVTSGFPNLFMLYGPGTNLGHSSIVFMLERQIGYTLQCLERIARDELRYLDVTPRAQADYTREMQRRLDDTVWSAGCTSWYRTASGRVHANWPGSLLEYRFRTRRPDWTAFDAVERDRALHTSRRTAVQAAAAGGGRDDD